MTEDELVLEIVNEIKGTLAFRNFSAEDAEAIGGMLLQELLTPEIREMLRGQTELNAMMAWDGVSALPKDLEEYIAGLGKIATAQKAVWTAFEADPAGALLARARALATFNEIEARLTAHDAALKAQV